MDGTVEPFEISESSWASTGGFSHLIMLNGADFKIDVRDSGHAPAEGGVYAAESKTSGVGRVLRHPNTPSLAEPRVPEQLLHATMVSHAFLARSMVAQRNAGRISDWIVGGLDTGYLAGKTFEGTEDPGRSKEDCLARG